MKRYCLMLDLKDDPERIAEYEAIHKNVWPGILESIRNSNIIDMQLYRTGTRMSMILEVNDQFSFEELAAKDAANPLVQEWEAFMWSFQQALPHAKPGEKWVLADKIFGLI